VIRINNITRGRFGNRVLQYNSLMQISKQSGLEASCGDWEGRKIFSNILQDKPSANEQKQLSWRDVIHSSINELPNDIDFTIDDPAYCLHNVFFKVTHSDPRDFFKINDEYTVELDENKNNIGVHFRGTDILGGDGNNGREIHGPEYYINSVRAVEKEFDNTHYYLCTDDMNFVSFVNTYTFLRDNGINFSIGDTNNFVLDFSLLSECDVLISSSSTFVVCAAFIGKKNKKIIHSKEWIDKNLKHELWNSKSTTQEARDLQLSFDNFWVEVNNGGGEYYKPWRIL
jgi:hypothetical protein